MDFNVRPAAKSCASSGRVFQPGEVCWSALIEKDGNLVRCDYCAAEWHGPPPGAVGHWRTIIPLGPAAERPKFDADSLFDYFLQLSESPNVVQQQYRYVLALLLLRKRRLILEDVVQVDGRSCMRLRASGGEGPFDVPEEELTEEQIARLQLQLSESGRTAAA